MKPEDKFAAEMRASMREAEARLRAENPEFASLRLASEVRAYRKTPQGWSKHQLRVVEAMLSNTAFLHLTNAEILERLAQWYDGYRPSESVLYSSIYPSSRPRIESALRSHGVELGVSAKMTLSKIKKALRARAAGRADDAVKGSIEIRSDYVIVGEREYAIDKSRNHPSVRVRVGGRRQYVRVDHLKALLSDTPSSST